MHLWKYVIIKHMFEFGKNIFLGLDVGTSSIKIAEISVIGDKAILTNYAWMPIEGLARKDGYNSSFFDVALPKHIKRIVSESGLKGKNTYVSIPAFGGLVTLIDFPQMSKEDIGQAIKFEAHKYIPISLDEVAISWDIVGEEKGGGKGDKIQVLLVAASKNKVVKYENLVKNSGLKLKSIEIEIFSMANSLIGNDNGTFLIIDIGSRVCNIILVSRGLIIANRNIDSGGNDLTKTIANAMKIDDGRAESLKISTRNFFSRESSISFPSLEIITGEASRLIESSVRNGRISKIDAVILSGGSSKLAGIVEYISKNLGVKAIIGNPLGRVGYDKRLSPLLDNIKNQFSVCIGLALKGAEEYINGKK